MFLQRLHIFSDSNIYYIPGGKFNTFTGDVRMPNCTTYSFLRMQEMCEFEKVHNNLIRPEGGFGNAKTWYYTTTLPKGRELKEGSILCFDGNYGHVAVLESIDGNTIKISQSQYDVDKELRNYKFWECRDVELVNGVPRLNGVGEFIGCIYPPIHDIRVQRNYQNEQIQITKQYVNARKSPNGELVNVGCYIPEGIYNVLSKQEDGEYMWYEIEKNHWVRSGDWLEYFEVSDIASLKKENEDLKERLRKIEELSKI